MCTLGEKLLYALELRVTITEPVVTKLTLVPLFFFFIKISCTKMNEDPSDGLFAFTRSQTDKRTRSSHKTFYFIDNAQNLVHTPQKDGNKLLCL